MINELEYKHARVSHSRVAFNPTLSHRTYLECQFRWSKPTSGRHQRWTQCHPYPELGSVPIEARLQPVNARQGVEEEA